MTERTDSEDPTASVEKELIATGLSQMISEEELSLTAHGQCMEPIIRDGETVTLARVRVPWPGDIVAVLDDYNRVRVHRVLGYRPLWRDRRPLLALVTRADNERWVDPPTPMSRLIGRVAGIGRRSAPTVRLQQRFAALGSWAQAAVSWAFRRLRSRANIGPRR